MPFTLLAEGFQFGQTIPVRYTCDGVDVSPALDWSNPPENCKSYALVVDDPDAPSGLFTHWLVWDIPGDRLGLSEGSRVGVAGTNDFGKPGYGGPCPPKGHGPHRYFFHLFAVDAKSLELKPGARRADFDRELRRHKTVEATFMGTYGRG
jgi:Raf kinase inhibitor-like YbhB/YbcL family protein